MNYLFIIDGSKALRRALDEVFGPKALVQRCRTHKMRIVAERIPDKTVKAQTRWVLATALGRNERRVDETKNVA